MGRGDVRQQRSQDWKASIPCDNYVALVYMWVAFLWLLWYAYGSGRRDHDTRLGDRDVATKSSVQSEFRGEVFCILFLGLDVNPDG